MRRIEVAGAMLALHEWGPRDGPLVLFWHSLGPAASGALAVEAGERLASLGWRFVAPDGPGFGASEPMTPARYALAELGRLWLALLDELGAARAVFMGHSWGGVVALHAAGLAPERADALVLLDSGHIDYADVMPEDANRSVEDWIDQQRARAPQWETFAALVADMKEGSERWSPALEAALRAGLSEGDDGSVRPAASPEARGAALWGMASTRASKAWPALADAGIPVLLLLATKPPHGEDNKHWAGRFEAALPQATLRWVPDASHSLLVDAGPPLADEIADWLEEGAKLRSRR